MGDNVVKNRANNCITYQLFIDGKKMFQNV